MAASRRNPTLDVWRNRAFTVTAYSDLATISGRHGDIAYDSTTDQWYWFSDQGSIWFPVGGTWKDVTFNASNFVASESMTWTVDEADVNFLKYLVVGNTMFLSWDISATDVGGTASFALKIVIPGGYSAVGTHWGTGLYSDAGGTFTIGMTNFDSTHLFIYKAAFASWTLTTGDNTNTAGTAIVEVEV